MGDAERVHLKGGRDIQYEGDIIRVTAEGVMDGDYYYIVDSDNRSRAFVGHPSDNYPELRGEVAFAERTASDGMVIVKPGIYDSP